MLFLPFFGVIDAKKVVMDRKKVVMNGRKVVTGRQKVVMIPVGHRNSSHVSTCQLRDPLLSLVVLKCPPPRVLPHNKYIV